MERNFGQCPIPEGLCKFTVLGDEASGPYATCKLGADCAAPARAGVEESPVADGVGLEERLAPPWSGRLPGDSVITLDDARKMGERGHPQ